MNWGYWIAIVRTANIYPLDSVKRRASCVDETNKKPAEAGF